MAWERPQKTIVRETRRIAIGVAALIAVMMIVYALMGRFTFGVALGALMGGAYGVFNFFMLGMTIQRAGKETDEAVARARVRSSYSLRMLGAVAVAVIAFALPFAEGLPCVIALLFPRLTILALQLTGQIKDE